MSELADLAEIAVIKDIELIDNPTATLPLRMIHEYQCIPVRTVADDTPKKKPHCTCTLWPPDEVMSRWVYAVSGRKVQWFMGDPEQITESITQNFGVGAGSLDESDLVTDVSEADEVEDEDAAVIRFVNEVVQKAVSDRATDIHFEPHRDELQIRYRIDGELVSVRVPDNLIRFQGAIISRLKIMAKLNISEKRRPQDGRISFGAGDSELDIRISTFPTMYGESVSLRLLNQKSKPLSMRELGLANDEEKKLTHALSTPHGIILVTGPTGSGKSTSLTAFIRLINKPERRIIQSKTPSSMKCLVSIRRKSTRDRFDLCPVAARRASPRSRRHYGRRNPRPRDGRHRHPRLANRSPRLSTPHQRRTGRPDPSRRYGH